MLRIINTSKYLEKAQSVLPEHFIVLKSVRDLQCSRMISYQRNEVETNYSFIGKRRSVTLQLVRFDEKFLAHCACWMNMKARD